MPKRMGARDGARKALKDCLDIRNLAFHNDQGRLPGPLATAVLRPVRRRAAKTAMDLQDRFPGFSEELEEAIRWLEMQPPRRPRG